MCFFNNLTPPIMPLYPHSILTVLPAVYHMCAPAGCFLYWNYNWGGEGGICTGITVKCGIVERNDSHTGINAIIFIYAHSRIINTGGRIHPRVLGGESPLRRDATSRRPSTPSGRRTRGQDFSGITQLGLVEPSASYF